MQEKGKKNFGHDSAGRNEQKLASFADRVKLTDYQLLVPRCLGYYANNFKHKLPPTAKKVHNY